MKSSIFPIAKDPVPYERRVVSVPSPIGDHVAEAVVYMPEGKVKTHLFVVHDMCDNKSRYEPFAEALATYGHAVTLSDLRGHGNSPVDGQYGYFSANEGSERQVIDIATLIGRNYQYAIPSVLLGFGMGALFGLSYLKRNPSQIAGLILSGPYLPWVPFTLDMVLTGISSFFYPLKPGYLFRERFHRRLLESIENPQTKFDWLNSKPEAIEAYLATDHCGEPLKKRGYFDLTLLMSDVYQSISWQITQRRLPIQVFFGGHDPVRQLRRHGPEELVKQLRWLGYQETKLRYFPNSRHELLFDNDAQAMFNAILEFCESRYQAAKLRQA